MFEDNLYSQFIYKSKYARYIEKEGRREEWNETVQRYMDFICKGVYELQGYTVEPELKEELFNAIFQHQVMPSMRALMTAGKAAEKNHIALYNCAYLPIDDVRSFDETMCISMSSTGVGFSVENAYVKELPELPDQFFDSDTTVVFEDSRIGWSVGFRQFLSLLLVGQVPKWDVSKLRPDGARLKTMGGRSSGPEPLVRLLESTIRLFKKAAGRKLTTIEAHDLECMIGNIVVVGGVRRSAFISLSDLNDYLMRTAKSGPWYDTNEYRRLANNSAIYDGKPAMGAFMAEWLSLYESKSGERGIVNREAIQNVIKNANSFRKDMWASTLPQHGGNNEYEVIRYRDLNYLFGLNPCAEIILRPYEFCNLTEVIVYPEDDYMDLANKVRLATILGTLQACFTNFKYINKKWKKNCEDERLLGVSLTGIYDNKFTNGTADYSNYGDSLEHLLEDLKCDAIKTNLYYSKEIGINSSVAITCVKPSGTSSALNGTSSGIHPAHAPYYIRYVRNNVTDPLTQFMIDNGFPFEKDAYDPANMVCFKFPIKASPDAIFKSDISAIQHLELWLKYQKHWCEHKPSITVYIKEHEWLEVGAWVYDNFEWMSGVTFFPTNGHIYKQAPFSTCTEEEYNKLNVLMPKEIDWRRLSEYENQDSTDGNRELACGAGGCEI